jgi:hypothetical protein
MKNDINSRKKIDKKNETTSTQVQAIAFTGGFSLGCGNFFALLQSG